MIFSGIFVFCNYPFSKKNIIRRAQTFNKITFSSFLQSKQKLLFSWLGIAINIYICDSLLLQKMCLDMHQNHLIWNVFKENIGEGVCIGIQFGGILYRKEPV